MTIHCAITYFDPTSKSMGYLIGSDRGGRLREWIDGNNWEVKEFFLVDKSFIGKHTIGFIRGSIPNRGDEASEELFGKFRTLDNVFDDIDVGVDYSQVPLLQEALGYTLLIGKQTNGFLDLYTVGSEREKNPHAAKRLFRLTPDSYHKQEKTWGWLAPETSFYVPFTLDLHLGENEVQDLIWNMLTMQPMELWDQVIARKVDFRDEKRGEPEIYRINFQGIQKISD